MKERLTILQGDWIDRLKELEDESVQTCVTSPPYWGLRNYGVDGQLGLEKTPEEYVSKMVEGFREVRRVMNSDGTIWLNLGDGYAGGGNYRGKSVLSAKQSSNGGAVGQVGAMPIPRGIKPKDLIGIPWLVAFALRADGWYLRCDIIWAKPNPMPESVIDRPTRAHEYIFLMSKSRKYFYDADAIKEPPSQASIDRISQQSFDEQEGGEKDSLNGNRSCHKTLHNWKRAVFGGVNKHNGYENRKHSGREDDGSYIQNGVNKRSVWTVPPANYGEAHFATFPPALIKPCILAGSRVGDTVLDPFFGSGTTGLVAIENGRRCVGIELNPEYIKLANKRCFVTYGLEL